MRLQDKVAIVTGSTKGIGEVTAKRFSQEGAKVVVTGRSTDLGEALVKEVGAAGGHAIFVRGDLAVDSDCAAVVDAAVAHFGALDILVNNAAPIDLVGSGGDKPVAAQSADEFNTIIGVSISGTASMLRHAIPHLIERGGGAIVNISSGNSVLGVPGMPAYTCSKGAINALTRQVAVDYGEQGIRSNAIVVGFVVAGEVAQAFAANETFEAAIRKLSCSPRLGAPEDIAEGAIYLASDAASWVNGSILTIDGGATIKAALPDMS